MTLWLFVTIKLTLALTFELWEIMVHVWYTYLADETLLNGTKISDLLTCDCDCILKYSHFGLCPIGAMYLCKLIMYYMIERILDRNKYTCLLVVYSYQMCMRATVSLSAQDKNCCTRALARGQLFLSRGYQTDRYPNYTFDNYFITPIKMINFKAIAVISALLVSVLH